MDPDEDGARRAAVALFPRHVPDGGTVATRGRSVQTTAGDVQNFSTTVTTKHAQARSGVVGVIAQAMKGAPDEVVRNASDVARTVLSGGGTIAWFGDRIEEFDGVVASLNAQLLREPRERRAAIKATLQPRYASALESLERDGRTVRTRLEKPLDRSTVTALYAAGALPSYVGNVFPKIDFSKVKLEALPYDLAGMSDQALADHLLKNPDLAYLLPVVPVAVKKIIGKELAERARNLGIDRPMAENDGWSGREELARSLEAYGTEAIVATAFLNDLGPKGLLNLSGRIALSVPADPDAPSFSARDGEFAGRFQDALAATLAAGTQRPLPGHPSASVPDSDSYVSEQWVTDLMHEGRKEIDPAGAVGSRHTVFGYQVLAPLLEHQNSNANFLNRVGLDMVGFEREYAKENRGTLPWESMLNSSTMLRLDWRSGAADDIPAGADPMGGLMKAFSSNPDAARDFFTSSGESSGNQTRLPMVDYLLTDREWHGDGVQNLDALAPKFTGDPDPSGIGYLGDALKAATLDDPDQRSVQIVESIVSETHREYEEEDKKRFSVRNLLDPAVREDMSHIVGRYMPSVYISLSGNPNNHVDTSDTNVFDDVRLADSHTRLFLAEVGKDAQGRENVTAYSNAHLLDGMNSRLHGVHDVNSLGRRVSELRLTAAEVNGAVDFGASASIAEEKLSADETRNKQTAQAVSAGSALLGGVAGRVPGADYVLGQVGDAITEASKQDSGPEVNREVGKIFSSGAAEHRDLVRDAIWLNVPDEQRPPGVPADADLENLDPEQQQAYDDWRDHHPWGQELAKVSGEAEKSYQTEFDSANNGIEPYGRR